MADLGFTGKGHPFLQAWGMLRELRDALRALQAILVALILVALGCNLVLATRDLDLLVLG